MKKLLLTLLMICGLMHVPLAAHTAPAADMTPNDAAMYMLNGGDVLNIQVFDNPELSSPKEGGVETNPYVVRPDGYFAMPLIGDINVNNKSTFDVTNEITARLSEYLKNPIVTINIMKEGSTRVYVLGEVKRQGLYELNKKHNLLDAISSAGGFTQFSAKKNVFVIRSGSQEPVLKVNVKQRMKGKNPSSNIPLYEGDCVFFTSNGKVDFGVDIYPFLRGAYYISEARDNMSSGSDNYKKDNLTGNEPNRPPANNNDNDNNVGGGGI